MHFCRPLQSALVVYCISKFLPSYKKLTTEQSTAKQNKNNPYYQSNTTLKNCNISFIKKQELLCVYAEYLLIS